MGRHYFVKAYGMGDNIKFDIFGDLVPMEPNGEALKDWFFKKEFSYSYDIDTERKVLAVVKERDVTKQVVITHGYDGAGDPAYILLWVPKSCLELVA